MSRFVSDTAVKVSVDDSGDWVEIKAKLTLEDRAKFNGALWNWTNVEKTELNEETGEEETNTVLERQYRPEDRVMILLRLAVTAWNIVDDDKPVPFSSKTFTRIDIDDPLWDKVCGEIADRNPTLVL